MTLGEQFHEKFVDSTGPVRPVLDRASGLGDRVSLPTLAERVAPQPATQRWSFSVVIPCYNYGRFLEGAVESVLRQSGVDVDVIIVNDASSDDTAQVAAAQRRRDPRVQVIHNHANLGHVRTFNVGLRQAGGDFIVRLDADDLLVPGSLERAAALFEAFPSVGLVYGHPRHFTGPHPPLPWTGRPSWTVWRGHDWIAERCRRGTNCITTPEAVLRRSVIEEVGGLNTNLRFAQDMEMWLRAAAVSDVGRVNEVDQALHRDHSASMSVTDGAGYLTDLVERRNVFDLLFESVGDRIGPSDELAATARRSLARAALSEAVRLYDRGKFQPDVVAQLVDFAQSAYPAYRSLHEWRQLLRSRRIGPAVAPWLPSAAVRVVRRRVASEAAYLRWTRTGL
jgi:hypothetical protein